MKIISPSDPQVIKQINEDLENLEIASFAACIARRQSVCIAADVVLDHEGVLTTERLEAICNKSAISVPLSVALDALKENGFEIKDGFITSTEGADNE